MSWMADRAGIRPDRVLSVGSRRFREGRLTGTLGRSSLDFIRSQWKQFNAGVTMSDCEKILFQLAEPYCKVPHLGIPRFGVALAGLTDLAGIARPTPSGASVLAAERKVIVGKSMSDSERRRICFAQRVRDVQVGILN